MENRGIEFNDKEQELYQAVFSSLSPLEFKKLNDIAHWVKVGEGTQIVEQGQKMSNLYLIYNGVTDVVVDGKNVAQLKDGQYVGEMSFMTEGNATASVITRYQTEYLKWDQQSLKSLMGRNPSLLFSLQSTMGKQLSKAVTDKNSKSAA